MSDGWSSSSSAVIDEEDLEVVDITEDDNN